MIKFKKRVIVMFKNLEGGMYGAITRALKYGNLQYKIPCLIFDMIGYSNHQIQDLEVRNKVYTYLKKHYSYVTERCHYSFKDSGTISNDIWICWLQGMDNAPDIVKVCFRSIKEWMPDKKIHVIDQDNLFEYIDLPDYILDKWKKGIISNTLFSDFVRLSVLTRFGGIWVDATVFMTGELPDYINFSDFFMYQSNAYDIAKVGESWFIKASSHNRILQLTLDLMNEYWKKEDKIRDYFLMFIFMKMAADKYPEDYEKMYRISAATAIITEKNLTAKYDERLYRELCNISSVHKLTYKIKDNNEDSLYNFLISKDEDSI